MPLHRVDDFFPIVITQHIGSLSDVEWQARFALDQEQMLTHSALGQKTTTIYDMTHMDSPTPTQREMAAKYVREHEELIREVELGTVFIVPNILMRGVLTAVFWIQGYPVPRGIVGDWDSAVAWCVDRLKKHNIAPPTAFQDSTCASPLRPHLHTGPQTLL